MKINALEVIRQGQIGGGESHLRDLVLLFDKEIVNPVVLSFTGGQMIDDLRTRGIKCYVVETSKAFDPKVTRDIADIISKEKIDIIHAHGSRAASNVFWLAKKKKLPFVYTIHGWSFHQDQNKIVYRLRAWSEKLLCHCANKVICVSESNKITGEKEFGLKNAEVIVNGVNTTIFSPTNEYPDLREYFHFDTDDFVIGFISRITKQKSPKDFVDSIILANKQNPRIKGLMVGDGDMKEEVEQYIADKGARDIIHTSPARTDVPALLHMVDAFCLPSLWEGLSIALLEAMSMAKPLIVTPTDGTRELIKDGENGIICGFGNADELAKAYIKYFEDSSLATQYGNACRKFVVEHFDNKRVSEEVEEIYKKL